MKLQKKLASLLLCVVLILSLLPAGIFSANAEEATVLYPAEGGNLYFDPATGTITMCDMSVTSAVIPSQIGGVTVSTIGDQAFLWCENLVSVTIPDSVTAIGDYAFCNCIGLTTLTIPGSVAMIGDSAFSDCYNITSVTIGDDGTTAEDGGTVIGPYAFYNCDSMTSLIIGDSVTAIGDFAFESCNDLTSITIGNSVTIIGCYAFYHCSDLTSITIPDSVITIDDYAFDCCYKLKSVTIGDGVTTIGRDAFAFCQSLESITIGDSVTVIDYYAFYDCNRLTSVTIPDSVTTIGDFAFGSCDNLTNVTLGNSVTTIGYSAFAMCKSLTNITIPDSVTIIDDSAFEYSNNLTDVYYTGSKEQWDSISVGTKNEPLLAATVHYNYVVTPFGDVDGTAYYALPVLWAVEEGVTTGTSAEKFSPDKVCTRGQIVTFLWRAAGSPAPQTTTNPFSDIKDKDYFYKAVLWAVEEGITSGTGKGKFSPDSECTRAQVATFLWRAQGEPAPTSATNTFSDVEQGTYYYNAVLWAVEKGITNGTGKGKFSPDSSCTRGQIVTFLYRALA